MARAKFSGCSVDITPGGNISFRCLIEPKSDCDFFIEKLFSKVPWSNCANLGSFGFCGSDGCCKNAVKQAKKFLSQQG